MTIAFTGGGTGGHIYPGLAIVSELQARADGLRAQQQLGEANTLPTQPQADGADLRLFWIGSNTGMDKSLVESAGIEFFGIPAGRLRRYFSLKTIPDFFRVIAGFFAARRILRKEKPALLFSKGGFVSVPPCVAAASLRIPVFTHESDFSPGLATKINVRFAKRIFTAYEETAKFFPSKLKCRITRAGNPVRKIFRCADAAKGREFLGLKNERILLVLGGSQGAKELNELVKESLGDLCEWYTVVHQTGPGNDFESLAADRYKPYQYIREEMPHVLAAAELMLGRSGAGTVWESAVTGKPMVLVPLSGTGTRGDQVENAHFFEKQGATISLTGSAVNRENLVATIKSLAQDTERRQAMAAASLKIGELDGAALIADIILKEVK